MYANYGEVNVVASRKRKCTDHHQLVNGRRESELQLFPTHPQEKEFIRVSQSPRIHLDTNSGQNQILSHHNYQSFTSLLYNGHCDNYGDTYLLTNVQAPSEARQDPLEKLIKSQYQEMRETCEQYFKNKYNDLLRQAEERASRIIAEKDIEMAQMRGMITYFQEKGASVGTQVELLNEVIKNQNTELTNIGRRNTELEEQQMHYQSQAQVWKGKAEKAEEMLWNCTASPRRHSTCCSAEEENSSASSFVGEEMLEEVKGSVGACKVCGKRMATVMMWPCKHLCICKRCDVSDTTKVCPVCNSPSVTRVEVNIA